MAGVRARDRSQLAQLAEEQAALRRVATLVAQGAPADTLFALVAEQVADVLHVPLVSIVHAEDDGTATERASFSPQGTVFPVGTRWSLEGTNVVAKVLGCGRPARIDDYTGLTGTIAETARGAGIRSTVGIPVVVSGRIWGAMVVSSKGPDPLPADTEVRLADFTELVGTAIGNTEAREEVQRLAEEQEALRRVATLVAHDVPSSELFAAVAREVGTLLGANFSGLIRYEDDVTVSTVAVWAAAGEHPPVPDRWATEAGDPAKLIAQTHQAGRVEDWAAVPGPIAAVVREKLNVSSSVGCPIVVKGRLWGALAVHFKQPGPLPPEIEARTAQFAELVGTAIANAEARAEVARLAEEQAALRRVATLVAEGAAPLEVFETVTREVGVLSRADLARMERYESPDRVTGVASWRRGDGPELAVGIRFPLEGPSIAAMIREVSRPVRVDSFADAHGPIAEEARALGIRSSVGCPIVVDGRLWGVIAASTKSTTPFPPDTESQIAEFTELVATAIANTEARMEVAASRARIVAATDDERRRVVRDLHDGAQQRMVHTVITLKLAQRALQKGENDVSAMLTEALDHAERATGELRELAHGILPSILTQGGLRAGVDALASRTPVPVEIDVSVGRLPAPVEATAYFVVAEALTNVAKHSRAAHAAVTARVEDSTVRVQVRDDGIGGAQLQGSGLLGLADRVAVLEGQLRVESPTDGGTLVAADIPLRD